MKKKMDLSVLYYIFCLMGFYAVKEVADSYLKLPLKIFLIVFLLLVSIHLLITAIKKSEEIKSFDETYSHRSYFELFKKLFYFNCYSYEDFLNISSKQYIENMLRDNSKKCINYAINDFFYNDKINSIITLNLFKEQIQAEPEKYNNIKIKIYGFTLSSGKLNLVPYKLDDDFFWLDEILSSNRTYKENPIKFSNNIKNYVKLNDFNFRYKLKSELELSQNDFYIVEGILDIEHWRLKECSAIKTEYNHFVNEYIQLKPTS